MTRKHGHTRSGGIKENNLIQFRYYHQLATLFPNPRNRLVLNGGFYVYGMIRANSQSREYNVEFRSRHGKIGVFLHGLRFSKEEFANIPHIYTDMSSISKQTLCLCLYRNKVQRIEYDFGDDLESTIIPWTQEWLYFYEFFLITGKWYGNGEHQGA
ncbi:hypothetical protein AUQ39_02525 [Lacticaseibacillus casei]|uniref:Type II CBASS E2 protein domain-containing protein n=1 Tax=Lacticaseibacillus zeae TaxID=57037 RepID=A0A5R8LSU6_LACZE|nr:hypothetical protein [Lacticaseibacillus zeae]OLS10850.1 hypothetical protein AUQ39_02525 [Lacticaseibacillus casei]QVI31208.1 hypothetical protein KG087_09770 [Lacticaseibacillus zeae]TLF40321.1 hypothetical protein FEI14_10980 [Lacticaseibacillus zeae]